MAKDTGINYASTEAKSKEDVDLMDKKQRLWDSLTYSYDKQKEQSDRSFNKAISQQDRALLGRGMQRSSYGMQTLGNLRQGQINAQNDIESAKIADYENRVYQLERDEIADDQWERQFAEGKRQFDENMGFQRSEAERQQGNWEKEFASNNEKWEKEFAFNTDKWQQEFAFSQKQFETQVAQWDKQFEYTKMSDEQKLNYNYVISILGQGGDPSDDMLAKAGLSRADANAMKAQVQQSSGGGGSKKTPTNPNQNPLNPQQLDADLTNALNDIFVQVGKKINTAIGSTSTPTPTTKPENDKIKALTK